MSHFSNPHPTILLLYLLIYVPYRLIDYHPSAINLPPGTSANRRHLFRISRVAVERKYPKLNALKRLLAQARMQPFL